MKVILVTGGAGFVGSYFIRYFLRRNKNYILVNMDKLNHASSLENLRDVEDSPRHHFVKGDICSQDLVNYIMKRYRPDYIINFAAESGVKRSLEHPLAFTQSNVTGTLTLLEAARFIWGKNNFSGNRFVQVSTDEVYGENNDQDFFTEESDLRPGNPYSASKAAADLIARSYSKTFGMPVVITRSCNNYGPYQNREKFVSKSIINALEDKPLTLYGDGSHTREWIHVQDHCVGIIRALFYGKSGEIYNVGTGEELSNADMAKKVLALLKKPEDMVETLADRPYHDKRHGLNSYKSRNNLSWSPKYKLEEGLRETILWYKNNRPWWDK